MVVAALSETQNYNMGGCGERVSAERDHLWRRVQCLDTAVVSAPSALLLSNCLVQFACGGSWKREMPTPPELTRGSIGGEERVSGWWTALS